MISADWIEMRLGRLTDFVMSLTYSIARYTTITKSSATGESDKVSGQPNEGTEPAVDDEVRRFGAGGWGIASVPPAGEPCLVVRTGGGGMNGVIVACGSKRYYPSNMEAGDVLLYTTTSGLQLYLKASDGSFALTDKLGATVKGDGSGNITVQAAAPAGTVTVTATALTGAVKLGPVGSLPVLVQGSFDAMGVPVTQNPAATLTIVKAG